jgi:Tol biopolymer transport system component
VAYAAEQGDKWLIVTDGDAGPAYPGLGQGPVFSADGQRVAYVAWTGEKHVEPWHLPHLDENTISAYYGPGPPTITWKDKRTQVVVNGVAGPAYDDIVDGTLAFSPDGARVAYVAQKGKHRLVTVDGVAGPEFDDINKDTLVFSANGRRVGYVAQKDKKFVAMVDGVVGPEYDGISGLAFSPEGRRVVYRARQGEKLLAVVEGVPGPQYDDLGSPVFSADGRRVAYTAKLGGKWLVVVEGKAGPEYDGLIGGGPTFTANGALEYLAYRDGSLYRVKRIPLWKFSS